MCCRAGGETEGPLSTDVIFCVEKQSKQGEFLKKRERTIFPLHAVVVCCKSNLKEQPNQSNARRGKERNDVLALAKEGHFSSRRE